MAISLTCQNVRRINGIGYVRWSDKTEQEFTSVADVRRQCRAMVENGEVKEFLRLALLAKWLTVDPTLQNPNLVIGRTITVDLDAAANIVRVS